MRPIDTTIVLAARERHEREWAREIAEAARTDGRPGLVVASPIRLDDIAATLHGTGTRAERAAEREDALAVGAGSPAWLIHADPPRSLDSYIDDILSCPGIEAATLFSAPADFVRHRHDTDETDASAITGIDAMQGYVEWAGCRHQALAGRGGADHPGACGHCDHCAAPPPGLVGAEDARSAIEAVRQTGEHFGPRHIVSVLRGERTPTVEGHRHDRLEIWARGRETTRAQWDSVLRQLLAAGILQANDDGGLTTTALSEPVRAGERSVRFLRHVELPDAPMPKRRGVPASRPAKPASATATARSTPRSTAARPRRTATARATEDAKRALYRWRSTYAAELGVPAIRILTDPDISRLITRRPTTIDELRRIITPSRCDAYGEAILRALSEM